MLEGCAARRSAQGTQHKITKASRRWGILYAFNCASSDADCALRSGATQVFCSRWSFRIYSVSGFQCRRTRTALDNQQQQQPRKTLPVTIWIDLARIQIEINQTDIEHNSLSEIKRFFAYHFWHHSRVSAWVFSSAFVSLSLCVCGSASFVYSFWRVRMHSQWKCSRRNVS